MHKLLEMGRKNMVLMLRTKLCGDFTIIIVLAILTFSHGVVGCLAISLILGCFVAAMTNRVQQK